MEAAKTKATTDTILADEAAKRQSLYQNQQLALGAANSVFGNQTSAFNAGNSALNGAAGIANDIGSLETPNLLKLLGTSAIGSALSGGIGGAGGAGGLLSGTGLNSTGNFGILGDLLGKIPGLGGGTAINSSGGVGNSPYGPVYDPNTGGTASTGGTGAGDLSTAAADTAAATGAAASTGGGITGALGSAGSAALGFLTNPVTAAVGGALLAAGAIIKSTQVHPTANTLIKDVQGPFGENLSKIVNGFDQALASGQLNRATAQQMRDQTASVINDFNNKLTSFAQQGSKQKTVVLQAFQTMANDFGARADYPNLPSYSKILDKMDSEIAQLPA
jgi:hypothetical protein